jgi:hypothetical protein
MCIPPHAQVRRGRDPHRFHIAIQLGEFVGRCVGQEAGSICPFRGSLAG